MPKKSPINIKTILPKVVDVDISEPVTNNDLVYPTKMVEESMQWCIDNIPGFEEMSTLNRLYALNEINNTNTRVVKDNIKKNLDLEIERQEVKRIIKTKVVEKNNTAIARNKSLDQIKADKQFDQLYKPERCMLG